MPAHPVINPEALATIRFLSGFTQTDLARRSGVRQTHISGLEAGKTGASGQTVRQLAKALNVPVGAILSAPANGDSGEVEVEGEGEGAEEVPVV